ncbi:hypothetical protein JMJ35_008692 [Cladonia borealis]|uniref:Fork-head domain-containing protein n=1 Tax=Cladonia borealis TaxID=184061 RepID=A0AA39U784_9LECA|nr:hypothetical protein JMJ35_008692 [Cladonia borealis]
MSPVCEVSDTAVSYYSQIQHNPVDRSPVPESLFPWQDAPPSVTFGQAYLDPYPEVSHSPFRSTPFVRAPNALPTSEQNGWYGAHQESLMHHALSNPQVQSPHPTQFSHEQLRASGTDLSLARPILPLSMSQWPLWADAMGASAGNEFTSNSQALEAYSYHTANRLTPEINSTATGHYPVFAPDSRPAQEDFIEDMPLGGFETDHESKEKGPCYANLIYQALMEAPGHKMILRDIYAWIARKTDKAKDPSSKGWQNSVRHNLSMNGAFLKVELPNPDNNSKKGFIWVLERSAVRKGIQSTTRFRSKTGDLKNDHRDGVGRRRHRAGKKGGKVVKRSTSTRSLTRLDNDGFSRYHQSGAETSSLTSFHEPQQLTEPSMDLRNPNGLPYWIPTPPLSTQSSPPLESYEFGTTPEHSESQPDYFLFDDAFGPDNGNMLAPNTGDIQCEDRFLGNGLDCLL